MTIDLTSDEGMQKTRESTNSTAASAVIVCSKCKGQLKSNITGLRCGHLFHARCASSVNDRCPKCNKPIEDVEADYLSFYITFGHPNTPASTIAASQDDEGELRQAALEAYAKMKLVKSEKKSLLKSLQEAERRKRQLLEELDRVACENAKSERERARDETKAEEMSRTISRNIDRAAGAAKLIDKLDCQRIVQEAWKQTAEAFVESSGDYMLAMAKAHKAGQGLLQAIRHAALNDDKERVERIVGFILSAVDDRRTEQAEYTRKLQAKLHEMQWKREQLQQLRTRNARRQSQKRNGLGDRQEKRSKKSANDCPIRRAKKTKITELDEDGLEGVPDDAASDIRQPSTGYQTKTQNLDREQVMNEVVTEWQRALEEERLPHLKYGYVKREESWELRIYGRGLDALDRKEYKQNVVSLSLNYITLEHLLVDDKFKRNLAEFGALTSIHLSHNRLNKIDRERLMQFWELLRLLAQVCPKLDTLVIHHEEGNNDLLDIQCNNDEARETYRAAVVSCVPQLNNLDGEEVTPSERHLGGVISAIEHPDLGSLTNLSRLSQDRWGYPEVCSGFTVDFTTKKELLEK
ncbi:hypothetical protein FOL47_010169 [Perkinsus chesapeaki]|uniref:RING-type domain-containing protein n=1 Tax=Perkinsus chesapeaki TaxID=330153 RepID=A0A7J6L4P8_PERCH|nr:hypothetical protein FOL47_010169 [Perkinsus chesapeaki]